MKKVLVLLVFFVLALNVSAMAANVTVVSDDVYTGAILKLRSLESESLSDSYYPFFVGKNVGIIKFEIETGLSEVNLNLRFTNNGDIILNVEEGPFAINGSEIILDLRETPNITLVEEDVQNVSEEVNEENISKFENENATLRTHEELVGYATKDNSLAPTNNYALGGLAILFIGLFMFFIVRSAYQSGAKAELRELERIDKKLDELSKTKRK
ncbi:hypothetical protein KAJ38_02520 [Candidatus Pacearchaeota archaeon]|nr:hypothetical protein [Candidatus Pacearchaeota archaeon]